MFAKKPEKQITDSVEEEARQVVMVRYLDSHKTGIAEQIVYSFVLTFKDGRCRILEATAEDPLLLAVLPKLV